MANNYVYHEIISYHFKPRQGVIIEWAQNVNFNDPVTDVLTSRTDIRGMSDDDHDPEKR